MSDDSPSFGTGLGDVCSELASSTFETFQFGFGAWLRWWASVKFDLRFKEKGFPPEVDGDGL